MTDPISGDGLAAKVAELSRDSKELRSEVQQLRLDSEQTRARADSAVSRAGRTWVGTLCVIGVVALLGFVVADNRQVSARLDTLTNSNLCVLYALIIGGYDPSTREAGVDRERYDAAFDQMRQLRAALECTNNDVPPRKVR